MKNALVRAESRKTQVSTTTRKTTGKRKKEKEPILPSKREPLGKRAARTSRTSYKMAQRLLDASTDLTRAATNTVNRAIKSWLSSTWKVAAQADRNKHLSLRARTSRSFGHHCEFCADKDMSPLNENRTGSSCVRHTQRWLSQTRGQH